jgi:hypothetical protein
MCRLISATERIGTGALLALLSVGWLAFLFAVLPNSALAESHLPRLHSVLIGGSQHPEGVRAALRPAYREKSYEDLTILAIPLPLFHITFVENESFRFVLPISVLYDSQEFGSLGVTEYAYTLIYADGSTAEMTVPVPNKLLRIRDALLAAESYWIEVGERIGRSFELIASDEPVDVNIGYFTQDETVRAYAEFSKQEIRLRHDLERNELETVPIHELFHIISMAIIRTEVPYPDNLSIWHFINRETRRQLLESTARWSEDEPITVPARAGGLQSRNIDTKYDDDCDTWPIESGTDLFDRYPYCISWLIKYYVEQIAGGTDTAMPEVVLDLIARAAGLDKITKNGFIQILAEGLPADRFPGATWQERWQRFYTSFAAAVLVQRPSMAGGTGSNLAFHDDAFSSIDAIGDPWRYIDINWLDYSQMPGDIYETPAANDAERAERLATIALPVELPPFAYAYTVFEMNVHDVLDKGSLDALVDRPVEPRSVFVYANGPEGTNAFLLRQYMAGNEYWDRRDSGSFERVGEFTLIGRDAAIVSEEADIPSSGSDNTFINLGLVNSGPENATREISWAYLAAPRIIPTPTRSRLFEFQQIAPVRLVGGSAYSAYDTQRRHQFENGDSFVFEVTVTSKLHIGADVREDIPEDERTIGLAIVCGENAVPVALKEKGSQALEVSASPSPRDGPNERFYYLLSGEIDPTNTVAGDCKVQVELTSLLNLGGGDHQMDDSYAVRIGNPLPEVSRLRVTSGNTVVYDSQDNILRAAESADGAYNLRLTVWFSTELQENSTSLLAGMRYPYDVYELPTEIEFSDVPSWSTWQHPDDPTGANRSVLETELTVPEADAPNGGFLYFSISAASKAGVLLDSDRATPGDQRDTQHFVMLDMDDYYLATLSSQTEFRGDRGKFNYQSVYRPFQAQLRLVPVENFERDRFLDNYHPNWARDVQVMESSLADARGFEAGNQAYLTQFTEMIELMGEQAPPDFEAQVEMFQTRAGVLVANIAAWEQALAKVKEVESDYRLLVSFIQSYRTYGCDEERMGPVPARFGGMEGSERSRYVGETSEFETYAEYSAQAWNSSDATNIVWRDEGACPRLETLHLSSTDYRKITALVSDPPNLELEGTFVTSFGYIAEYLRNFSLYLDAAAHVTFDIAQRFDVSGAPPLLLSEYDWSLRFREGGVLMPTLADGLLVRVDYYLSGWPFPVDGQASSWEQRTGEAPYREDYSLTFSTRQEPEGERLDSYYNTIGAGGGPTHPSFVPDAFLNDVVDKVWRLENRTGIQITDITHPQSYANNANDRTGTEILGVALDGVLAGSLSVDFFALDPPADTQQGRSQFSWQFARNAVPETHMSGWPEVNLSSNVSELSDPVVSSEPETDDPDYESVEEISEVAEEPEEDPGIVDSEETNDENTAATNEGGQTETSEPPGNSEGEGAAGWPLLANIVEPTIRYPGIVQGIITNGSTRYEPGHVAVYLTGEALPPRDGEPLQMELNAGFPQSLVGIAEGRSIRFHNGEMPGGPHYYIFTDSDLAQIDEVIYPGEEVVIPFPQQGRLTVGNRNDTTHILEVLVLPSTRFNVLETFSYIIRDVPPGTYTLHAITENRRYQPFRTTVEVTSVGRVNQEITLVERGARTVGLAAE